MEMLTSTPENCAQQVHHMCNHIIDIIYIALIHIVCSQNALMFIINLIDQESQIDSIKASYVHLQRYNNVNDNNNNTPMKHSVRVENYQ